MSAVLAPHVVPECRIAAKSQDRQLTLPFPKSSVPMI
jgi:hypothetical protein